MYVGRFLVAGPGIGAYRVSSRSFPHRKVVRRGDDTLTVVPTDEAEPTDNPYVSYNCARRAGDGVVVGNGSHVDPVTEKYESGYPARDALASSLLALDFEKDDYDTPRIAAVVTDDAAYLGTVRRDALLVRQVDDPHLVATYEEQDPRPFEFPPTTASAAAKTVYGHEFEHAVCAAGVRVGDGSAGFAVENGRDE
ncbi:IMP cyclohydrolase [Candidatus Halobonum tyrrellensis]|uniref:IMP cyclohydrolase n=1 Tax=Candidatus Halobonum tyrrellensis G22 TaxID=1324957 RepID=V4HB76_9EURY|nr:IMP cyclohydrolase [Candidatus Halobonum tyrrellensis]ESP87950.1 IMP cyclohydrolase [Candidatus Halobonum tyrrellensis G22]